MPSHPHRPEMVVRLLTQPVQPVELSQVRQSEGHGVQTEEGELMLKKPEELQTRHFVGVGIE